MIYSRPMKNILRRFSVAVVSPVVVLVVVTCGVFRNSIGSISYRGNKYNGTFRFTVAPWMDTASGKVLHLGAAGSLRQAERDPEDGKTKLRYTAIPESNLTAAVNWYLSAYTRFMLNYTYADIIDVGTAQQIVARFQVVF